MTEREQKVYNATVARLARIGAKDPTSQIIELAEEIDLYRDKIIWLETRSRTDAPVNAEPQEAQDRLAGVFKRIKAYLVNLFDEWRALPDNRRLDPLNIQTYNHVRAELDDLYDLAEEYGIDLDEKKEAD